MSGKRSATSSRPILFDGWPLVYAPGSPAALHLLELFEALPVQLSTCLALPGDLNAGTAAEIDHPPAVQGAAAAVPARAMLAVTRVPARNTRTGRMIWEQRTLPGIAKQVKARALHTTSSYPPLISPVPVVVSPVEGFPPDTAADLPTRLRESLGQGGLARASAVLWPADFPVPVLPVPVLQLPLYTHSAFQIAQPRLPDLPESYLLAPEPPKAAALELLAAAWSWASAGLGEDWVLLTSGLDASALEQLRVLSREAGASGPVEKAVLASPAERAAVFQHAGAVLLTSPPRPWADAFLHALACARPIVAEENPLADARTGPAGYLVQPGDARALGAAALTVLVEEDLAARLTQAAETRVVGWQSETFATRLCAIYDQR